MKIVITIFAAAIAATFAIPVRADGFNPTMIGHMMGPMTHMFHPHSGYEHRGPFVYGRPYPVPVYRYHRPLFIGGGVGYPVQGGYEGGGYAGGGYVGGGETHTGSFHIHTEHFHEEHVHQEQVHVERHEVEQAEAPEVYHAVVHHPYYRPHRRVYTSRSCGCCCCCNCSNASAPTQAHYISTPGDDPPSSLDREVSEEDAALLRSVYK